MWSMVTNDGNDKASPKFEIIVHTISREIDTTLLIRRRNFYQTEA